MYIENFSSLPHSDLRFYIRIKKARHLKNDKYSCNNTTKDRRGYIRDLKILKINIFYFWTIFFSFLNKEMIIIFRLDF